MNTPAVQTDASQPRQALSLFDSTSIIVGIIIGSAIYEALPAVARNAGGWASELASRWLADGSGGPSGNALAWAAVAGMLGVWIIGGLVALLGAMCYAELATAHPEPGGTYVFLSKGLGPSVGFAFAWCEFWIVRPGNIGAVAFVLARYALELLPARVANQPHSALVVASASILFLAALNAIGLRAGTRTQNFLTVAKVVGLAAIVLTALTFSRPAAQEPPASDDASLGLALILVMFAYGGWADMSFVAAEVRDPKRNVFRALLLGTLSVTAIYLAVNLAFLYCLGSGGLAAGGAVAADVMARRFGDLGARGISLLVVVSCLGAINGMLFTGARVYYALGTRHPAFRWLGQWNARGGVPLRSLALQTFVTLGLVVGFGLYPEGFQRLVVFTGPFYWGFIGLVGVALLVLRRRDAGGDHYRVPFFPLTPLVFVASCGAMAYAAVDYAVANYAVEAIWAAGVVVAGVIAGWYDSLLRALAKTGDRSSGNGQNA